MRTTRRIPIFSTRKVTYAGAVPLTETLKKFLKIGLNKRTILGQSIIVIGKRNETVIDIE